MAGQRRTGPLARDAMAYVLAGGCILGTLFTYISSSAFVFTTHFTLSASEFSYLFAGNSLALVLGGQLDGVLRRRGMDTRRVLRLGLCAHFLAGLLLLMVVLAGVAVLPLYIAVLAFAIGALGLVFGNLTALTMAHAGGQTGVASALMGMLQYLLSAIVGYGVSLAVMGPLPLPLTIVICGALAILCCRIAEQAASRGR